MELAQKEYLDKLGPIMPYSIKPVHVGWYARNYGDDDDNRHWLNDRDYWDGKNWWLGGKNGNMICVDQSPIESWRGLAEKPE